MTAYVFLDIDGVLNGIDHWPWNAGRNWIDPLCAQRLNRITREAGATLVLTSSWRSVEKWDVPALLAHAGVEATVVGGTPYIDGGARGLEIAAWMHDHPVDRFVILDDDADMGALARWLVRTQWTRGLEDHHVPLAIEVLRS